MNFQRQLAANRERGPFYEDDAPIALPPEPPVRLIAYFLPQFHPIPENDRWWGRGFTEWTNVAKATPRYEGHLQPHLPGELGFYDLRLPDVMRRQAELVRSYGLEGLCFHHYWFHGRTLLDGPIRLLLAHPEIDLPFCVNWANEGWSRRWDGSDQDVLIAQTHSPEDDLAFAAALEPLFRDPRYIRVRGRPLLMLYKPSALPDASATIGRWRAHFQAAGLGDPYVATAQTYDDADPRPYGADAAAGFPPHNHGFGLPTMTPAPRAYDRSFKGQVVRYADLAAAATAYRPTEFRLLPGVCPRWDNEARKPGRGFSLAGGAPAAYGAWLEQAGREAMKAPDPDERIVFINAWNEWAEGAHLEPDRHFGYAYLAETARTLARLSGRAAARPEKAPDPELPPKPARELRDWPGLIAKNLAFHAADAADAAARLLRRMT